MFATEHAVSVAAEVLHGAAAAGIPTKGYAVARAQITAAHHLAKHLVGRICSLVTVEVLEILKVPVADGLGEDVQRKDARDHGRVAVVPDAFQRVEADVFAGALEDVCLQEYEVGGAVHLPFHSLAQEFFQVFDVGIVFVIH